VLICRRWKSDVSAFPALDSQTEFGPTYSYEYSTREAYGTTIDGFTQNDPLNATWWHLVTEGKFAGRSLRLWRDELRDELISILAMETNNTLVEVRSSSFHQFAVNSMLVHLGRSSILFKAKVLCSQSLALEIVSQRRYATFEVARRALLNRIVHKVLAQYSEALLSASDSEPYLGRS
jgi:hypothetical protein